MLERENRERAKPAMFVFPLPLFVSDVSDHTLGRLKRKKTPQEKCILMYVLERG